MARNKTSKESKQQTSTTFSELEQKRKKTTLEHLRAPETSKTYAGHVKRGRAFLAERVKEVRDSSLTKDLPEEYRSDDWQSDEFANALGDVPNHLSPHALAFFITFKTVDQGCKSGTAEQIRAAFKNIWDQR